MAQKNEEVMDWLKKGAAIGFALLSKKDTLSGIFERVYDKENNTFRFKGVRQSFQLLGRMMKAFFKGEYKDISPWFFISTVAGIAYFETDKDIIPDKIPIIGVADDVGMLMWVFNIYSKEIDKFDFWDAQRTIKDIQLA